MSAPNTLPDKAPVAEVETRQAALSPEQKHRQEQAAAVQQARGVIGSAVEGNRPASDDPADETADKPPLSPEQMQELLTAVEQNFNNLPDYYEHREYLPRIREGVTFAEVQACLENDPMLARQVYAMHQRGGRPDVWGRHGKSFLFFESVQNTVGTSRNCVYGKAQADWLIKNRPGEQFNGSVEEQRETMDDVGVVAESMWQNMQNLGSFTDTSWEWTDSDDVINTGVARRAARGGGVPRVGRSGAGRYFPDRGWRAVAKGSKA